MKPSKIYSSLLWKMISPPLSSSGSIESTKRKAADGRLVLQHKCDAVTLSFMHTDINSHEVCPNTNVKLVDFRVAGSSL